MTVTVIKSIIRLKIYYLCSYTTYNVKIMIISLYLQLHNTPKIRNEEIHIIRRFIPGIYAYRIPKDSFTEKRGFDRN